MRDSACDAFYFRDVHKAWPAKLHQNVYVSIYDIKLKSLICLKYS